MKLLYRLTILGLTGLFLSGCSLVPSAWKSARPGGRGEGIEELDAAVTSDLETSMDADLKQIDQDLKSIDEETKNY